MTLTEKLAKCKKGDRVRLRNGTIALISRKRNNPCLYPIAHDRGEGAEYYHYCYSNGKSSIGYHESDIIEVLKKSKVKPELNTEVMKKLYEFGGLTVYEVHYFDKVGFKTVLALRTFSKEHALKEEKKLSADFTVAVSSYSVSFDGAFQK